MKTLTFRADDRLVEALDAEAQRAGRSTSDLLSEALRQYLYRLAGERDVAIYQSIPLTAEEAAAWPNESWVDEPGTDWDEILGK
jgi:hypothetical protein